MGKREDGRRHRRGLARVAIEDARRLASEARARSAAIVERSTGTIDAQATSAGSVVEKIVDASAERGVDGRVPRASSPPGNVSVEHVSEHAQSTTCLLSGSEPIVQAEPYAEAGLTEEDGAGAATTSILDAAAAVDPSAVREVAVARDAGGTGVAVDEPSESDEPSEADEASDRPPKPAIGATSATVSTTPESTPPEPSQRPSLRVIAGGGEQERTWIPRDARPTTSMIRDIFMEHPEWIGVLGYDDFRREVCKRKAAPWDRYDGGIWTDDDTSDARCWMSDRLRASVPRDLIYEAIKIVARRARYNSLADDLRSHAWDGRPRLREWGPTYLRGEDTAYHRDVAMRWMLSAVARGLVPGCKADHVLVLEGLKGGERKSTALEIIAGRSSIGYSYYCADEIDISSTFAPAQLIGVWIYELQELILFKTFGSDRSKAFISKPFDDYSRKHQHQKTHQLRTHVFAATTNKEHYLDDPTGSRRTWPYRVGKRVWLEGLARDRGQIIAECVHVLTPYLTKTPLDELTFDEVRLEADGLKWWLDEEGEARARDEQELRYTPDAWEEPISKWLDKNSDSIDVRGYVTVSEVLEGALRLRPANWTRREEMRVAVILTTRFGWKKGKRRLGPFGGLIYPYYLPEDDQAQAQTEVAFAERASTAEVASVVDAPAMEAAEISPTAEVEVSPTVEVASTEVGPIVEVADASTTAEVHDVAEQNTMKDDSSDEPSV